MAPADPSPQDYKVAASAMQMESQARVEQSQEKIQENEENLKEEEQKRQEQEQEKPFFEDSIDIRIDNMPCKFTPKTKLPTNPKLRLQANLSRLWFGIATGRIMRQFSSI